MAKRIIITAARLREILNYHPDTGEFYWVDTRGAHWRGKAGYVCKGPKNGYVIIDINNRPYYAHILAYLWMTGKLPPNEIDHKNQIRHDNRWINLRPATRLQNCLNSKLRKDNTSGIRGVNWNKGRRRWEVRILGIKIGEFREKEQATLIAMRLHKLFAAYRDKQRKRQRASPR